MSPLALRGFFVLLSLLSLTHTGSLAERTGFPLGWTNAGVWGRSIRVTSHEEGLKRLP